MGVTERRAREKEALRNKIVEAASQLFVEQGFENVSIRKIAERIEYSPATIYLYFKDKAELIGAICADSFEEMAERIGEAAGAQTNAVAALRAGCRAYIDFALAHPNPYLVLFGMPQSTERDHQVEEAEHACSGSGLEAFDFLRNALSRCMSEGAIQDGDVETTAQSTWMFIHGVAALLITSHRSDENRFFPWLDKEHLIESSLDLLLAGLQHAGLSTCRK
jgi:AcrR family transcriptional regulator